jgi:hypothetical protein
LKELNQNIHNKGLTGGVLGLGLWNQGDGLP